MRRRSDMSARRAIAVDLGGTQLRVGLFAEDHLLRRSALPTDVAGGPAGILAQITTLTEQLCDSDGMKDVIGIGMSCAGPIDTASGQVTGIPLDTLVGFWTSAFDDESKGGCPSIKEEKRGWFQ